MRPKFQGNFSCDNPFIDDGQHFSPVATGFFWAYYKIMMKTYIISLKYKDQLRNINLQYLI